MTWRSENLHRLDGKKKVKLAASDLHRTRLSVCALPFHMSGVERSSPSVFVHGVRGGESWPLWHLALLLS